LAADEAVLIKVQKKSKEDPPVSNTKCENKQWPFRAEIIPTKN
jgi:hypothetical protein